DATRSTARNDRLVAWSTLPAWALWRSARVGAGTHRSAMLLGSPPEAQRASAGIGLRVVRECAVKLAEQRDAVGKAQLRASRDKCGILRWLTMKLAPGSVWN